MFCFFDCVGKRFFDCFFDKPCIILKGSGRRTTTIYGDDTQSKAIFTSSPPNVVLSGITIELTQESNHFFLQRNVSKLMVMLVSCGA